MKFKSLHEKAKLVDNRIDEYIRKEGTSFPPMKNLQEIVLNIFPEASKANFGLHKIVFHLWHKSHELALKVGKSQTIELDHKAYKQMPRNLRHVYFARVFWHTRYCLLQEYGIETIVSAQELAQIRAIAYEYDLLDITCDNIKVVNGTLKIIDASIAPPGFLGLWKIADFIKLRMPPSIRKAIRKVRLLEATKKK